MVFWFFIIIALACCMTSSAYFFLPEELNTLESLLKFEHDILILDRGKRMHCILSDWTQDFIGISAPYICWCRKICFRDISNGFVCHGANRDVLNIKNAMGYLYQAHLRVSCKSYVIDSVYKIIHEKVLNDAAALESVVVSILKGNDV